MLRVAVIGTEAEAWPLIAAAERIPQIECVFVPRGSSVEPFDAVAFCGVHEDGVPAICEVARRGRHLLVDIAALTTAAEAATVIAGCRDADVQLMIGQPLRYLPSIQAVRRSLDAGELGKPGLLRVHRWVAGQGEALEQRLLREVDLAIDLFDGPPATVYAVAREADDSPRFVQAHLGFTGGGMALIDLTTSLPDGDDYYSLSLIGDNGSASADDHHNMQLVYSGGPAAAERTRQHPLCWTEPLRELATAIEASRQPAIGGDAALSALGVTAAVRRSIDSGCAMHWQGERYEPV